MTVSPSGLDLEHAHGSHVAGIIASRAVGSRRGLAPGVRLHSYQIFPNEDEATSTFALSQALRAAVDDGCDVINLSVTATGPVPLVERDIRRAIEQGVIVCAAAGNASRAPIQFPAAYPGVIGVSAAGRAKTYPAGTESVHAESSDRGTDPDDYVAGFSNWIRRDDLAAPGVGTISCFPDGAWGVFDGTSQATPVVSAIAARRTVVAGSDSQGPHAR